MLQSARNLIPSEFKYGRLGDLTSIENASRQGSLHEYMSTTQVSPMNSWSGIFLWFSIFAQVLNSEGQLVNLAFSGKLITLLFVNLACLPLHDIRRHFFGIDTTSVRDFSRQGLIPNEIFVNLAILVSNLISRKYVIAHSSTCLGHGCCQIHHPLWNWFSWTKWRWWKQYPFRWSQPAAWVDNSRTGVIPACILSAWSKSSWSSKCALARSHSSAPSPTVLWIWRQLWNLAMGSSTCPISDRFYWPSYRDEGSVRSVQVSQDSDGWHWCDCNSLLCIDCEMCSKKYNLKCWVMIQALFQTYS